MVLEDLQDPGNAGTILRTGEGAGVSGVFLTKTCVDITNPKVIRSTMGSIYRMPFLYVEDVVSLEKKLKERGMRSFAAHLKGENSYDHESYKGGIAFFIGKRGKRSYRPGCGRSRLPDTHPDVRKSRIAECCYGIRLMYEAARQRRE